MGGCGRPIKVKMTKAEKYLLQLHKLNDSINAGMIRLDELRAAMYGMSGMDYSADRVQTSPKQQMEEAVARYMDYSRYLDQRIDTFVCLKEQYEEQIAGMQNPVFQTILYMKYIQFKSIKDISNELKQSIRHIYRKKKEALQAFETQYLV